MKSKDQSTLNREFIVSFILVISLFWLIYTYRVLISPLIISCLIAYILYPVVTWLSIHTRPNHRNIVPLQAFVRYT